MSRVRPEGRQDVWDAVVVGAGPAGAMTAHELARSGASVLVVDRRRLPRWKVCGACLSPGAQTILSDAGLGHVLSEGRAAPLRRLHLRGWGREAFVPLGPSVVLSRYALDHGLALAAVGAGATFMAPARARLGALEKDFRLVHLDGGEGESTLKARVVIAADGLTSPILAQATGNQSPWVARESRIGFGAVFRGDGVDAAYPPGAIHMAVGDGGYVGLVRQEDGSLDVAAALDPPGPTATRLQDTVGRILQQAGFPSLPEEPGEGWKGTPKLTRRPAALGAERVFAVGDAAGYVEPFTGEGMAWALAGARTLAPLALEGVHSWNPALLSQWEVTHQATVGRAARLCRSIAWALRRPVVARTGLRLLQYLPLAASPVVRRLAEAPIPRVGSAL